MNKNPSKNLVGVTGEYYVAAELGKQNIMALLTPRHNPLFDIVAVSPDGHHTSIIQVKTISIENKEGWPLNKDMCKQRHNKNLFVILVNLRKEDVEYYIYEYDVLSKRIEEEYKKYISTRKKNGKPRKNLDLRPFDFAYFKADDYARKNKWSILGFNKAK